MFFTSTVTITSAFRLGEKIHDPLLMYMSDILTISANLAAIPGISVPIGKDSEGMPIGLQIMGNHFQERSILNLAKAIESTCGLPAFIEEAVSADGYGHFLSRYDGEENEEEINGITYYIYRNN